MPVGTRRVLPRRARRQRRQGPRRSQGRQGRGLVQGPPLLRQRARPRRQVLQPRDGHLGQGCEHARGQRPQVRRRRISRGGGCRVRGADANAGGGRRRRHDAGRGERPARL